MSKKATWRLLGAILSLALLAAACGSDDDTTAGDEETTDTTEAEESGGISTTAAGADEEPEEEEEEAMEESASASGTLRYVEFSPVTTFDPAKAQTAQSVYLYPVYDTLTRQNNEFGLEPSLATSWEQPDPNTWVFQIRDDITFHDGSALDGQVVADNMNRSKATEGNPNGATWAGFEEASATGDYEVTATFGVPQPQFPIEMSMVMGMMVSPTAMADETDLTRDPQGSGPWIW
ncbi:MAG: ABC transporter substrate-binding protein, partial [Acidimicrobiales bacterium]